MTDPAPPTTPQRRPRSGRRNVVRTANHAFLPPPLPPDAGGPGIVDATAIATMVEPHINQICRLAEILLGAAHSDGFYSAVEAVAIGDVVSNFVDMDPLHSAVKEVLDTFRPERFDLATTCSHLDLRTDADKRELIELVATVVDADKHLDAGEQAYLVRLGAAIGLPRARFEDILERSRLAGAGAGPDPDARIDEASAPWSLDS